MVRTKFLATAIVAASIAGVNPGAAADFARGRSLHNANCTDCHGNMTGGDGITLYTRSPRMVNARPQLEKRVRYCATGARLAWSEQDIADVVQYLDKAFYNFNK